MKSILLLAAVYSLIIHQWHKEKQGDKVLKAGVAVAEKKIESNGENARHTAAVQFMAMYRKLAAD
jgi:hypothetical protein